ncbi:acetyltransferase [Chryseobacterium sp. OV279]|uniref:acetyltransferase n=1 Tax=Chryseobacterium sp. OV279 TaxID=1500285 RepID=UPI0009181104|nr:acetyltransferase [Chryseobacterium sp. OV279]SHE74745.1 sugar O-acyltransferase, sialic acid O-acetyltransferase NeuD family [Chryseobacterium sp. OV279]
MKKIAIIGAGGFGREVKMLIDHINQKERQFELVGFYDDKHYDHPINGIPYLGKIEKINEADQTLCIAVAIGDPKTKKKIIESISNPNIEFPNLIHPSVIIGQDNVKLGKGNIICAGVIITVDIEIEDFVILNLSCTVGHDTKIKNYSSFMPTVNISGEVVINEAVYVGTGAKIINLLEIGENTIVGAGAVVYKSLPANCTAVGIPAKPIKFNN